MRCLVTGGAGFIGSHLVGALCALGHQVTVYDNLTSGRAANLDGLPAGLRRADIRDRRALADAMAGQEVCYHLAALVSVVASVADPESCHDINVTGTFNVLAAAREAHVQRVVLASSAAVYGDDPTLPKTEDMSPAPRSPYAVSKWQNEIDAALFASVFGLPATAFRFFNVYGPRQDPASPYSGVIARFVSAAKAGERPQIMGDGRQTRDFIYVGDLVAGLLAPLATEPGHAVYNLGTGRETDLLDILGAIGKLTAVALSPEFLPPRSQDIRRSVADISLARSDLGFDPQTPLGQGLAAVFKHETT